MQILWEEKEGFVKDLLQNISRNLNRHTIQFPQLSGFWKKKVLWIIAALANLTSIIPW